MRSTPRAVEGRFSLFDGDTEAPRTPFLRKDGSRDTLLSYPGRPVIATFWATWCGACAIEMPRLARLAEQTPQIVVAALAVDRDESFAKIERFYRLHRIRALEPAVDMGRSLAHQLKVPGTPTSLVLDGAGGIRATAVGNVDWDDREIRAYLLSLA